jgi:Putative addiction module component
MVLLESLPDDADPPIQLDPAYEQELLKRIERINRGETKMLTLEELMTKVRERPSRRRAP